MHQVEPVLGRQFGEGELGGSLGRVAGDCGGVRWVVNDVGGGAGYDCGIMVEYLWNLTSH